MASQGNPPARPVGGPTGPANASPSMATNQQTHLHPAAQHAAMGASPFSGLFRPPHGMAPPQGHHQHQPQAAFQVQPPSHIQNTAFGSVGGTSSPSLPTPGSVSNKRPPLKPPGRPTGSIITNNSPLFKTTELTPAARRKKQKLPEKKLPDRVAALLPESALYTQLLEFEARVDAALTRKKIDIQESLKSPPSLQRTLRIYVFNTFANQARGVPETKSAETPSWSLKIIGRILEDGVDPDAGGGMPKHNPAYPKFSYFLKRLVITLDPAVYPENPIVWEHSRSSVPQEGFEVKRIGDKEFTANIRMEMNYNPEKFKLSPALMELLGIEVDTRARIIAAIWHYVKARKLQNPTDPSFFACDQQLKKVFGEDKVKFSLVSQKISPHLSAPQPIHLEHRIKLSGDTTTGNSCYDVLVDVPLPLHKEMTAFLSNTEKTKEIETCDELIVSYIKKIHEHRRRRAFFLGFSQSPVEFINALIASQSKDLKLTAGEASRNAEKERRSDFYNQPWVEDAVIRYLNRKPTPGNDVPGSS